VRQSIVPLIAGIWLIVGGVMLVIGNFALAHQAFNLLVPLTLIAMGLWAIVRANRLHRLEQELPSRVTLSEIAFAVALLLVYGWINGRIGISSLTARPIIAPVIAPEPIPLAVTLTTPVGELPKNPKLVMIQQLTTLPVQLDIVGSENFAIVTGQQNIRAIALNSETARIELVDSQQFQPRITQFREPLLVGLKVPKTAILEINGSNFAHLIVRDMEGDVQVSYGGANPIVTIATKGDIAVRQLNYPQQSFSGYTSQPYRDELTLFPGPNSRVMVSALAETIRIYAQQPPQREWQVRVEDGTIEVRLPSNSSVKLRATTNRGAIQIPFGQTQSITRNGYRWLEHNGTLNDGKVPITLRVARGSIMVVLTR